MKTFDGAPQRAATWGEIAELGAWLKLQIGQEAATAIPIDDFNVTDPDTLQRVHDDVVSAHLDASERVLRVIKLSTAPPTPPRDPAAPDPSASTPLDNDDSTPHDDSPQRRANFAEMQRMAMRYRSFDGWRHVWAADPDPR